MAFLLRPFLNSVQEVDEDEKGGRGEERLENEKKLSGEKKRDKSIPFFAK